MSGHVVTAAAVKVSIGDPGGNTIARILRRGSVVPDGVDADKLTELEKRGLISKQAATTVEPAEDDPAKPVGEMTAEELKAYAAEHNIDLTGASKKDDILAAIQAAQGE